MVFPVAPLLPSISYGVSSKRLPTFSALPPSIALAITRPTYTSVQGAYQTPAG